MSELSSAKAWFSVQWNVDVQAENEREAWLVGARLILKRAEEMAETGREIPVVKWRKLQQSPRGLVAQLPEGSEQPKPKSRRRPGEPDPTA